MATSQKYAVPLKRKNRKINEKTEKEEQPGTEPEGRVHHSENINHIKEQQQRYTANVKIHGKKSFVTDTGSPVTKMPMYDEIRDPNDIRTLTTIY